MNQLSRLKPALYVVLIVLITVIYFRKQQQETVPGPTPTDVNIHRESALIYTKHARCRMECRDITESEIASVIEGGNINKVKSDPADRPCPTLAYEGKGTDGHRLRVVIADCEEKDKVVTVIDLDEDHQCDCK